MAHATPRVQGATLVDPVAALSPISVGTPAWYAWLEQATTFAFSGAAGHFTARKEQRGHDHGYWRAYRKRAGKLHSTYLGKSIDLTLARLQAAAAALAADAAGYLTVPLAPPAPAVEPAAHRPQLLPSGTVTFLLIDIDGGTAQWPDYSPAMLAHYTAILERAIRAGNGAIFKINADRIGAAFASPLLAASAALGMQRALAAEAWGAMERLPARMALHTEVVAEHTGDYAERHIHWVALLVAAGHGHQILLSQVTQELIGTQLPADAAIRDLGAYYLADIRPAEHLFQLATPDLPATFPPLRPPARRPHNLPVSPTPLIGRERDLASVLAALQHAELRLLTLTGPGGVGKTRLGLQVATALRETFADGVFFIDLSALHDPDVVIPTIAQTLGVIDRSGQSLLVCLCDYLATKQLLLLLDNFEQVLPAAIPLAVLLANAPRLKLLVTSRAALHLAGEHEFPVVPLPWTDERESTPAAQATTALPAAMSLFLQRAQAINPNLVVTEAMAPLIAEICRRLDGLPLAIELAAAWVKLFPPAALLQRLDQRLPLLTGGPRDLPARQQTLRNTCDWSYRLLAAPAQTLFHQLAVFAGGFTLAAAEMVCGDQASGIRHQESNATPPLPLVLDGLAVLVDHSLLRPVEDSVDQPRFTMLETLQEYALEQLHRSGAAAALRERHATYYLSLAEQAEPELSGPNMRIWLGRLEAELANIRAALGWALAQGAVELAARLAAALAVFWNVRSYRSEGRDYLEAILASGVSLTPAVYAKTLYATGYLARSQYDRAAAIARLELSLALYRELDDERGYTAALTELGWAITTLDGDTQQAAALLEDGLARYRRLGDQRGAAWALHGLGWVEQQRALGDQRGAAWAPQSLLWVERQPGSLDAAHALYAESLALRRAIGDTHGIAWSLVCLGMIAAAQLAYSEARAFQEERLTIERALGNRHGVADTLRMLGVIAFRQGDEAAARAWLVESLALARVIGDKFVIAFALTGLADVAHAAHDHARAKALLEEALEQFRALEDPYRMASVYAGLAQVALDTHDDATAHAMALHSLQLARTVDDPETICACLAGMADSAAGRGDAAWAAQLWGAAEHQLDATTTQRAPVEPQGRPQLIAAARESLGAQPFAAAWAAGRALTPEEALADSTSDPTNANTAALHPRPASPRPAGLTPRELAVLLLLAEGHSNAQIAERLVISPATVNTYLSAIYRKLGVASRTAAMRYVIDNHIQ